MTKQMIADGDLPTAIFSASDPLAIGAMRALYENGYKIPDDISIIGFDDISVASFSNPPLTTIHTRLNLSQNILIIFYFGFSGSALRV